MLHFKRTRSRSVFQSFFNKPWEIFFSFFFYFLNPLLYSKWFSCFYSSSSFQPFQWKIVLFCSWKIIPFVTGSLLRVIKIQGYPTLRCLHENKVRFQSPRYWGEFNKGGCSYQKYVLEKCVLIICTSLLDEWIRKKFSRKDHIKSFFSSFW